MGIAEANWSKVSKGCGILTLCNEAKVGRIYLLIHRAGGKGILAEFNKGGSQNVPVFLGHERVHSVRVRDLVGFKREHNFFTSSRLGIESRRA